MRVADWSSAQTEGAVSPSGEVGRRPLTDAWGVEQEVTVYHHAVLRGRRSRRHRAPQSLRWIDGSVVFNDHPVPGSHSHLILTPPSEVQNQTSSVVVLPWSDIDTSPRPRTHTHTHEHTHTHTNTHTYTQ